MNNLQFKVELSALGTSLIARVYLNNFVFVVPRHRGIGLQAFTNEKELKSDIRKLVNEAIDNIQIEVKE